MADTPLPSVLVFREHAVAITDDVQARAVLLALGVADKFQPEQRALALKELDKGSLSEAGVCGVRIFTHPTHYLAVFVFERFGAPEDNGLAISGFSKDVFPRARFDELFAKAHAVFTAGQQLGSVRRDLRRGEN
jgi:hypothetical protein